LLDTLEVTEDNILSWGPLMTRWEIGLLSELGFGLNLEECAATGVKENLTYVSPKSGRSVCQEAGLAYHDKMLPLPKFLVETNTDVTIEDVKEGLGLTEFFMERHMLSPFGKKIPQARRMILDYIS
ncbi:MAG: DNA repair protein RecO, partial [Kordiimonadaceae bacterium]|nr:DNA repair protein RecO [Kordiimonadaceae bacterium]